MRQCIIFAFVIWVRAQEYYDNVHNSRYAMRYFKEIPKHFEIKGGAANKEFKKYFDEIEKIAQQENITVIYKVNLEIMQPPKYFINKAMMKKVNSKKYNIPLKKNSMKLSNFEVMLRKMAEHSLHGKNFKYDSLSPDSTTEEIKKIISTRQVQLKFKPIISKLKTNYTKVIRPVKNRIITLKV